MRLDCQGTQGRTLLHHAVLNGQAAAVAQLLAAAPAMTMAADAAGATPLHLAARHPDTGKASPALVALLLGAAAPCPGDLIRQKDGHGPDGWLAVHCAAAAGHAAGVALLARAAAATATACLPNGRTPLHLAAYYGRETVVQQLVELAGPLAAEWCGAADSWGNSPLHLAAWQGQGAAVRALLAAAPHVAATADDRGLLPLHRAAKAGQEEAAAALLDTPAGLATAWARAPDGSTPLALAAAGGHLETAAVLLQAAPDTALSADQDGLRPFARALLARHEDLAAWLLEPTGPLPPGLPGLGRLPHEVQRAAQSAATAKLRNGLTPLCWAAKRGDLAVAALLLRLGLAAPGQEGGGGRGLHALHLAAAEGQEAMVELLLQAEPSVAELRPWCGPTALHLAAQHGHSAVVAQLLRAAPDAAEAVARDGTPLLLAVQQGHADVTAQLLAACPQAGLIPCGPRGLTPLHQAVWQRDAALAALLLHAEPGAAEVQSAGRDGGTPLALAASRSDAGMVALLLKVAPHAAELADGRGLLPLHHALSNTALPGTRAAAAALLRAAPAAAARRLPDGATALWQAAGQPGAREHQPGEDAELLEALLRAAPAAAAQKDSRGYLPIHRAAQAGCLAAVCLLIRAAPATVAQAGPSGCSPLGLACHASPAEQRLEVVRALLAAAPAAAACASSGGSLPIHWAAWNGFAAAVPLLLAAAPATAVFANADGDTALHLAVAYGHRDTALAILAAAPHVACLRDGGGRTALWRAVSKACSCWEDVAGATALAAALAAAAPAACFERDASSNQTPLDLALLSSQITLARSFVGVQLAAGQPPAELLRLLNLRPSFCYPGQSRGALIAHAAAQVRLSPDDWQLVPAPTPGLGAALPAVLQRSLAEAALLVARLPQAERQRLRCAALYLSHASRRRLHAELVASVLALSAAS
ncbi:hypothetical protein ABPG75_010552 [Micractinium tetrahymenae]